MNDTRPSLLRSAGAISAATAVSRVLGLLRETLQAYLFGAGWATDAFVAAFRLPSLLRDLFAEGALSSAFVPAFTAARERGGEEAAWRLARRLLSSLIVVLGGAGIAAFVFAGPLLALYAPGFDPGKAGLAAGMTRILSPFLLCVALAAVAMGMLNTLRVFFLPALAPAWFNVACIAGMILLPPLLRRAGLPAVLALPLGAAAGGVLQLAVQIPALRRRGFRFRFDLVPADPEVRRIAALTFPAAFGLAATQVAILLDTAFASTFGDGAISWLSYAFRLVQLPIGLFGVALGTANLARVSTDAARGDREGLRRNLAGAIRAAALLALPATAGLVALSTPIVRIVFEHGGRFTARDTARTAGALVCYALGVYAYTATKIQAPTFYALGRTRLPAAAAAAAVAVKVAASVALLALVRALALPPLLALAAATSLAAWVNCAILAWGARRLGLGLRGLGAGAAVAKMAAVSAVLGGACALSYAALEAALPGPSLPRQAVRLALASGAGAAIAAAGSLALGVPEARAAAVRARAFVARRKNEA